MRDFAGKRYWLIGASEGLGLALARLLSGAGAEVILSARSPERLAEAVAAMPGRAKAVPCDVADGASVRAAAEAAGGARGERRQGQGGAEAGAEKVGSEEDEGKKNASPPKRS